MEMEIYHHYFYLLLQVLMKQVFKIDKRIQKLF